MAVHVMASAGEVPVSASIFLIRWIEIPSVMDSHCRAFSMKSGTNSGSSDDGFMAGVTVRGGDCLFRKGVAELIAQIAPLVPHGVLLAGESDNVHDGYHE